MVYSPVNADFDVDAFVSSWNGYLASYYQTLDGVVTSGAGVVSRVATEYSVNPRLLLAVLEYQSGWVTESSPASETMVYPMRVYEDYREGLYSQLSWAASFLNEGFYQWAIEAISIWTLTDSTVVEVDPTINAGTAGVLNLMSNLTTAETWARRPLRPAFTNLRVALWQPIRLCCGTAVARKPDPTNIAIAV